jgi:hypothetical protein
LIDKKLFEIGEDEQKGQKWGKTALKKGWTEKFSFWQFWREKVGKPPLSAYAMGSSAAALPEGCFAIFRKNANLTNPLTSGEDMRPSALALGKERYATHSAPRG